MFPDMGAQLLYSVEGEVPGYGYYFEKVDNLKELLEQVKSGGRIDALSSC